MPFRDFEPATSATDSTTVPSSESVPASQITNSLNIASHEPVPATSTVDSITAPSGESASASHTTDSLNIPLREPLPGTSTTQSLTTTPREPISVNDTTNSLNTPSRELEPSQPTVFTHSLADLCLLHHWNTMAGDSLSPALPRLSSDSVWQNFVVELGFQHQFVLDSVLAVAAVHRASLYPAESPSLVEQAGSHMSNAFVMYHRLIDGLGSQQHLATPMFAFALLLTHYDAALALFYRPANFVEAIISHFSLVHSARLIIKPNLEQVLRTPLGIFLNNAAAPAAPAALEGDEGMADADGLEELCSSIFFADPTGHAACVGAIKALNAIVPQHLQTPWFMSQQLDQPIDATVVAFKWPFGLSKAFMSLLVAQNDVALVILARWARILAGFPEHWCMGDWAGHIVDAVRCKLPPMLHHWFD